MQTENRRNVLQRACLDEHLRTARRLLCRLEEDAHAPRELRLMLFEQERRAKYRRDMEVVPAGVHPSSMLRAIRQIRLLLDRQGIDIGAQRNERLPLPDLRDQSCLERQIQNADPRTLQGGANPLRRLDLLVGELGMTMEPLKFLYDECLYILNCCHDILPLNSYMYDMLLWNYILSHLSCQPHFHPEPINGRFSRRQVFENFGLTRLYFICYNSSCRLDMSDKQMGL